MNKDYIKLALKNIAHRRLRAWLTILGIVIGIAAIIALFALGRGFQYTVDQQFSKIGADKVTVQAKGGGDFAAGTAVILTEQDYNIVRRASGVEEAVELFARNARMEYNNRVRNSFIRGMPMDETRYVWEETGMYNAEFGRMLKSGDQNKIVIGPEFAKEENFGRAIEINDKILINEKQFTVIGILEKGNNPGISQAVLMTLEDSRELFDEYEEISMIEVKVEDAREIDDTIANIKKDLRRSRNVREGQEDFIVISTKQYVESFLAIFNVITVLLVGLASISLIVGMVGIANTMYTAVLERTKEIGIMKSIGATNGQVLTIFLIESALIGLIGGLIGVFLGSMMALGAEVAMAAVFGEGFFQVFLPWWLTIGAVVFSMLVGTLSGVLPAKQASELSPVDAFRG
ncbi:MAG TPA: ABC transporter permease [Alphaproteobacteria bacterium]|nr:ABC transporter permease [Alphaproteobacteria bacterium]